MWTQSNARMDLSGSFVPSRIVDFPTPSCLFRFLGVHAALATNISSVFSPLIASRVKLYIFEDVFVEMLTFGTLGGS